MLLSPSAFYAEALERGDRKAAFRYSLVTGALVALELTAREFFSSGSTSLVLLTSLILLPALPALMAAGVHAWTWFMGLSASLLGEKLPRSPLKLVVAYSVAGFLTMGFGFTVGKWLSLGLLVFQVFGVEKMLKCSRWTAVVFVGLPFCIVGVVVLLFTLMFKVF